MASTEAVRRTEPHGRSSQPSRPVERGVPRGIALTAAVAWRLLVIAAAAVLIGYAAMKLLVIVIPFVVAVLFTTLLHPPARRLQRLGLPRTLSAVIVVGLGLLLLAVLISLVVPPLASEADDLSKQVEEGARELAKSVGGTFGVSGREIDRSIDNATRDLDSRSLAAGLVSGALIVAEIAAAMLLTVFLTFFLVRDGDRIWTWIVSLSGVDRRQTVHEAGVRAWAALSAYFKGVACVATVDAVAIGAVLVILGVPMAFPLTVLTFLAAFFPIVGAFAAGGAAVLVALAANGTTDALILLAAIVVVQQLEGNVLYPMLVGSQLNLHPVAMIMVLGVGGVVAGVAGAFLAVPLAAVVGAVLNYARSAERHAVLQT